jgi:hypothetical protein
VDRMLNGSVTASNTCHVSSAYLSMGSPSSTMHRFSVCGMPVCVKGPTIHSPIQYLAYAS